MKLWTYRHRFSVGAQAYLVLLHYRSSACEAELWQCDDHGKPSNRLAHDLVHLGQSGGMRNFHLKTNPRDGQPLTIEAGSIGFWSTGIKVSSNDQVIHESHPGRVIEFPARLREWLEDDDADDPAKVAERQRQQEQFNRNLPSITVDVLLGILFFIVAKFSNLTTAALVGAGAGLALVVIQRFVKVDLLGGLAMFGILMLLVSAGFSLAFESEWMVQMKSTILGVFVAGLFLIDALNGGRYFGKRIARYLPYPDIVPARLSMGMVLSGVIMASLNFGVAKVFSPDTWLYYTTFVDTFISIALVLWAMQFAREPKRKSQAG